MIKIELTIIKNLINFIKLNFHKLLILYILQKYNFIWTRYTNY